MVAPSREVDVFSVVIYLLISLKVHKCFSTMDEMILNCDLGENESAQQTEGLMALVGAANICCGVHAGSPAKTRATLELAQRFGVLVGAHPGLAVAGGRGSEIPSAEAFDQLLREQLGSILQIADEVGVPVNYVKLHGSLYHAVEQHASLAEVYIGCMKALDGSLGVFSLAGGCFAARARAAGLRVWEEAFADRGYMESGQLVPRGEPGAVIQNINTAVERIEQWQRTGKMPTVEGESLHLRAETVCVHSDSPNALELLKALG